MSHLPAASSRMNAAIRSLRVPPGPDSTPGSNIAGQGLASVSRRVGSGADCAHHGALAVEAVTS